MKHDPTLTGREKVDAYAKRWGHPVADEIEAIARRINGGRNLPRPWSQANGGPL